MKFESLNEVYENDCLFYWCNATGDINMPGDGKNSLMRHNSEELPPAARDLFENYWSEYGGCNEYVVSYRGKTCYAFSFILNEEWVDSFSIDTDLFRSVAKAAVERMFSGSDFVETLLYGENTDPDGDEIVVIVPYEKRDAICAISDATKFGDCDVWKGIKEYWNSVEDDPDAPRRKDEGNGCRWIYRPGMNKTHFAKPHCLDFLVYLSRVGECEPYVGVADFYNGRKCPSCGKEIEMDYLLIKEEF